MFFDYWFFFSSDTYIKKYNTCNTFKTAACWFTETTPLIQYRESHVQKIQAQDKDTGGWGAQSLGSSMKRCVSGLRLPPWFLPHRRWGTQPEDRINKSTDAASSFHSIPLMNNTGHLPPTPNLLQDPCAVYMCTYRETNEKHTQVKKQADGNGSQIKFSHTRPWLMSVRSPLRSCNNNSKSGRQETNIPFRGKDPTSKDIQMPFLILASSSAGINSANLLLRL